jgi:hypothetical protein
VRGERAAARCGSESQPHDHRSADTADHERDEIGYLASRHQASHEREPRRRDGERRVSARAIDDRVQRVAPRWRAYGERGMDFGSVLHGDRCVHGASMSRGSRRTGFTPGSWMKRQRKREELSANPGKHQSF